MVPLSERAPRPLSVCLVLVLLVSALFAASPVLAAPVANVIPQSDPLWTTDLASDIFCTGDVNGDGFSDVMTGWNGRLFLFMGSRNGLSASPSWTADDSLCTAVVAGDINRDGFDDIIVAEPMYSGTSEFQGRVQVLLGSRHGLKTRAWWQFVGQLPGERVGQTIAFAGDVNGDGYGDFFAGSYWFPHPPSLRLFLGRPGKLDPDPAWILPGRSYADGIGDVNGDGIGDVAVFDGPALVFHGSRSGLANTPSWTGPAATAVAGGGDVNGDGFGDLILVTGILQLYRGGVTGLESAPSWETEGNPVFGGLSIGGDLNQDGISDVADGHFVYLGGRGVMSNRRVWRAGGLSGGPVTISADVNGDGHNELVLAGITSTGRARVGVYELGPGYPAPWIVHEPVLNPPVEDPIVIEADVSDSTNSVVSAEINYRFLEDLDPQPPIRMTRVSGNHYRATIPAPTDFRTGIYYTIRAVDDYGLVGQTELVGTEYSFPSAALRSPRLEPRIISDGNRSGRIEFTTSQAGRARVRLFDVAGRLVATLLDNANLPTGQHRVEIGKEGLRSSGVYFYRIETADDVRTGRFVQVR
jgi:hypothetical protein